MAYTAGLPSLTPRLSYGDATNLNQIQEDLKDPEVTVENLMAYANGASPQVPAFLALGELNRRRQAETAAASAPTSTVKQNLEQSLISAPQTNPVAPTAMNHVNPVIPQQQVNPIAPQQSVMHGAHGGLASVPLHHMFHADSFAGGGIVAFDEGGETEELPDDRVHDANAPEDFPVYNLPERIPDAPPVPNRESDYATLSTMVAGNKYGKSADEMAAEAQAAKAAQNKQVQDSNARYGTNYTLPFVTDPKTGYLVPNTPAPPSAMYSNQAPSTPAPTPTSTSAPAPVAVNKPTAPAPVAVNKPTTPAAVGTPAASTPTDSVKADIAPYRDAFEELKKSLPGFDFDVPEVKENTPAPTSKEADKRVDEMLQKFGVSKEPFKEALDQLNANKAVQQQATLNDPMEQLGAMLRGIGSADPTKGAAYAIGVGGEKAADLRARQRDAVQKQDAANLELSLGIQKANDERARGLVSLTQNTAKDLTEQWKTKTEADQRVGQLKLERLGQQISLGKLSDEHNRAIGSILTDLNTLRNTDERNAIASQLLDLRAQVASGKLSVQEMGITIKQAQLEVEKAKVAENIRKNLNKEGQLTAPQQKALSELAPGNYYYATAMNEIIPDPKARAEFEKNIQNKNMMKNDPATRQFNNQIMQRAGDKIRGQTSQPPSYADLIK